jgi:hypothetical protein
MSGGNRIKKTCLGAIAEVLRSIDLSVFRYTNDLEKERWVEWEGDDPMEFVELAHRLGDGMP